MNGQDLRQYGASPADGTTPTKKGRIGMRLSGRMEAILHTAMSIFATRSYTDAVEHLIELGYSKLRNDYVVHVSISDPSPDTWDPYSLFRRLVKKPEIQVATLEKLEEAAKPTKPRKKVPVKREPKKPSQPKKG